MIYKAQFRDTNQLMGLPESGMGYQLFEAESMATGRPKQYVAYNSELVLDLDAAFGTYRGRVITEGFKNSLSRASTLNITAGTIKLLNRSSLEQTWLSESVNGKNGRHSGGKGAQDNPKEYANGAEVFVRLSAYEDDRRIDVANRCLKAGSFTTTTVDYETCVRHNDDPVDRYALPNDDKIEWAFYIKPLQRDQLQRGIVQPAFGHAGGGIEAFFENGTSAGTYLRKTKYGARP